MREIKFRAWFKNENEIKKVAINNIYEGNRTHLHLSPMPMSDYRPIELMQYTGLKDKNDQEIYEGDILQFSGRVVACGIVKYNENLCCFQACHKMSCWLICKESGVKVEIIGNIYENPELMEGVNVG